MSSQYNAGLDKLVKNIGIISRNNSALASALSHSGKSGTAPTSPKELRLLLQDTGVLARETGELLLTLQHDVNNDRAPPRQQPMLAKLSKDFQFVLRRFQQLTEQSARQHEDGVEGQYSHADDEAHDDDDDDAEDVETAGLLGSSVQIQQQHHHHQALASARADHDRLAERARIVTQTETTLSEVKEIFQDLAGLVADQTSRIENISSSIENTASHASRAAEELQTASKYHGRNRARKLCLYVVALVVAAMMLLYLSLSLRS